MAKISNITSSGTKYDIRATAIPFGRVDSTSTATDFTATVPGITELTDGTCVMLDNGVVTSASGFTLNVNGLGAKPVYSSLAAATRDSTIFNIAYTMLFVYDETRVSGGFGFATEDTMPIPILSDISSVLIAETFLWQILLRGIVCISLQLTGQSGYL